MYKTLTADITDGICVVTINRPEKMNALNRQVFDDLDAAVDEICANDQIRSAIITGAGGKAFVAGADIAEFTSLHETGSAKLARRGQDVFFKIENAHKPVIAAVNGFALGGGCELALACHFIYASENAKFGQPEVNLGLIPGYGGTQRLTRLIGRNRAMELLMTGNMLPASEAMAMGIVNKVLPAEDLLKAAKETLALINSKAPLAVARVVQAVNAFDHTQRGFDTEIEKFAECFNTADMKEGTAAFLEKRKANFTGK